MNEEILNLEFEGFYGVFVAHESCFFLWRLGVGE
jgi:hypothetical protein